MLKRIIKLIFTDLPVCCIRGIVKALPVELFGNKIRFWYYKRQLFALGHGSQISEGCEIYEPQLIAIGHRSSIGRYSELNAGPSDIKPCLIIGDDTWLGPYCFFRTVSHRFDDPHMLIALQGHGDVSGISIGNDVYAGAHCVFLPGTKVGDHSVIAAGSVVSGHIPDYSIVVGNPARVVRKRV